MLFLQCTFLLFIYFDSAVVWSVRTLGEARPLAEVLEHFRNLAATKSDDVASFPGKPEAAEAPAATDAAATGGDGADA